jgi:branched-chain amino acid transport system permease protein
MDFFISQSIDSLALGALLFIAATGLSLIFGLLNVAILFERVFTGQIHGHRRLNRVLLASGFIFVLGEVCRHLWRTHIFNLAPLARLDGSFYLGGMVLPRYRTFVTVFGLVVAFALWLFLERSCVGAMMRAGGDNTKTPSAIGINVPLLFSFVFALGLALAVLGGIVAGPILGIYFGLDVDALIPAFIVIVVGGVCSLRGAIVVSLLLAFIDTFGKAYLPDMALVLDYLLMVILLLKRPQRFCGIFAS